MFALTLSQMGLSPLGISLLFILGVFFFISFLLTSKNMDAEGLLRVLYSKPFRLKDGTVENRNEN